ncbi:Crp/Fnr family transcriptional regulator [Candidatus Frankia alpina]|uniref:Crp/Fnr family transcriptional regulator n=1 Tax=Candidatus Frankia alpina TaxID=2699483 RepID=UPI0013D84D14|nr:Crp/Fnr family transcriptional regulator [Candidatus Frankia alpina]
MHDNEAVALLRATTLLKELDEEDLLRLASRAVTRRFRRGQVVFTEGEPGDTLLVVATGRLKVLTKADDGRDHVLNIAGPRETVGELNIVEAGTRSASVEALEPTTALLLDRTAVWELVRERPAVAEQLIRALVAHVRRLTGANADLVFLDLPRRVAKLLLRMREAGRPVIELGLAQTEIASLLGGSRQSVNQALREFERRTWILSEGQTITILQVDRLRRFAGD